VEHECVAGRLLLHRTAEEREPILHRLRRIEGQVRGLQQMIEQDRYCLDEIQQANAVCAAMREVIVLISRILLQNFGVFEYKEELCVSYPARE